MDTFIRCELAVCGTCQQIGRASRVAILILTYIVLQFVEVPHSCFQLLHGQLHSCFQLLHGHPTRRNVRVFIQSGENLLCTWMELALLVSGFYFFVSIGCHLQKPLWHALCALFGGTFRLVSEFSIAS